MARIKGYTAPSNATANYQTKRFDLIGFCSESVAQNQHEAIQSFIQGTIAEKAPVVPISAQLKYNVDAVCEYIVRRIPVPVRDFTSPPQMIVIRSFDVNKPGSEVDDLQGGVAGGSILQVRLYAEAVGLYCYFQYVGAHCAGQRDAALSLAHLHKGLI